MSKKGNLNRKLQNGGYITTNIQVMEGNNSYTTTFTPTKKCRNSRTNKEYYVGSYVNSAGKVVQGLYNGHKISGSEGLPYFESCDTFTTNIIQVPDENKRMAEFNARNDNPKECFNEFRACVGNLQKVGSSDIVQRIFRYTDGRRKTTAFLSKKKFWVIEDNKFMVNKSDLPTVESIEITKSEYFQYRQGLLNAVEARRQKGFMNMFRKEKVKIDYLEIKQDIFKLIYYLDKPMQAVHNKFVALYGVLKRYGDSGGYSEFPINRYMAFVSDVMNTYFSTNEAIYFHAAENKDKTKTYVVKPDASGFNVLPNSGRGMGNATISGNSRGMGNMSTYLLRSMKQDKKHSTR